MSGGAAVLLSDGEPEPLRSLRFPAEMFDLLGVHPALGRAFTAEEEQEGKDCVVVLYDNFWRRRFGADKTIIGREINFDGRNVKVVGVMPPSF